jgi:hypothetical protein
MDVEIPTLFPSADAPQSCCPPAHPHRLMGNRHWRQFRDSPFHFGSPPGLRGGLLETMQFSFGIDIDNQPPRRLCCGNRCCSGLHFSVTASESSDNAGEWLSKGYSSDISRYISPLTSSDNVLSNISPTRISLLYDREM